MTTEVLEAPVATPTPAETLRHAARYIEEHGWTQLCFERLDGSACALGAVMSVTGAHVMNNWNENTTAAVALLVSHLGFSGAAAVAAWNDSTGRTREEVLEALRGAARDN